MIMCVKSPHCENLSATNCHNGLCRIRNHCFLTVVSKRVELPADNNTSVKSDKKSPIMYKCYEIIHIKSFFLS